MGGILQDSINEMGAKAVRKAAVTHYRTCWEAWAVCNPNPNRVEKAGKRFPAVWQRCFSRVVTLEDSRKALVGNLK